MLHSIDTFPKWLYHVTHPPKMCASSPTSGVVILFYCSFPGGCVLVSCWHLRFYTNDVEHFFMRLLTIIFLCEVSVQICSSLPSPSSWTALVPNSGQQLTVSPPGHLNWPLSCWNWVSRVSPRYLWAKQAHPLVTTFIHSHPHFCPGRKQMEWTDTKCECLPGPLWYLGLPVHHPV